MIPHWRGGIRPPTGAGWGTGSGASDDGDSARAPFENGVAVHQGAWPENARSGRGSNTLKVVAREAPAQIGPYAITREIGRGAMGVVYLGRDTKLDRDVAIKALPTELAEDAERLARLGWLSCASVFASRSKRGMLPGPHRTTASATAAPGRRFTT